MSKKSEKLKLKLSVLSAQLAEAQRNEREADKAELLRLVDRAGCLTEALAWARAKAGRRSGKRHIETEAK